jgi:hypothetical protein
MVHACNPKTLGGLCRRDHKFKPNLDYVAKSFLKKQTKKKKVYSMSIHGAACVLLSVVEGSA